MSQSLNEKIARMLGAKKNDTYKYILKDYSDQTTCIRAIEGKGWDWGRGGDRHSEDLRFWVQPKSIHRYPVDCEFGKDLRAAFYAALKAEQRGGK